jgi:hypothetical protein
MQRLFKLIGITLFVTACSSGVETRIHSSGTGPLSAQTYHIAMAEGASADVRRAYVLVQDALSAQGFAPADDAAILLQITVDSRDAALALGTIGPQNLSAAKGRKPLQNCADKEFRLGLTMTRIADGAEIYRSRVAEYHCKMPLSDAMPSMVDAAVADLGKPRGSYLIRRNAVE